MSYKPIIYRLAKEPKNSLETINHFITTWYEIELRQCDFSKSFGVKISTEINQLLNYLTHLNYTIVRGKKRMIYSGFEYLFRFQNLKIGYDEINHFLFLFQEGRQDFYYGIPREYLRNENPPIFRMVKNHKDTVLIEDCSLIDFLVSHLCVHASKIGVKEFGMFITEDDETKNKVEKVCKLFDYKTNFKNLILFERDNAIAAIQREDDIRDILTVNTWSKGEKDIIEEVKDILEWNGWSDNTYRYKL